MGMGWCVSNYEWREMMNDPKVIALLYTVEPVKAGRYDKAGRLRYSGSPEFDLTVEDKIARFEFRKFYAYASEAREAIEPFIQHWELQAAMRVGSDGFRLRFKEAEIVDRNPLPPEQKPAPQKARARAVFKADFSVRAVATLVSPHYPPPPGGGSVDLDDSCVVKMKSRYDKYRLERTTLPDAANFCLTVLADKYGGRPAAARKCGISKSVLDTIGRLASTKGGEDARKAIGADDEFTRQEKQFLKESVRKLIIRAAQVAADESQRHPQITMADLPSL